MAPVGELTEVNAYGTAVVMVPTKDVKKEGKGGKKEGEEKEGGGGGGGKKGKKEEVSLCYQQRGMTAEI